MSSVSDNKKEIEISLEVEKPLKEINRLPLVETTALSQDEIKIAEDGYNDLLLQIEKRQQIYKLGELSYRFQGGVLYIPDSEVKRGKWPFMVFSALSKLIPFDIRKFERDQAIESIPSEEFWKGILINLKKPFPEKGKRVNWASLVPATIGRNFLYQASMLGIFSLPEKYLNFKPYRKNNKVWSAISALIGYPINVNMNIYNSLKKIFKLGRKLEDILKMALPIYGDYLIPFSSAWNLTGRRIKVKSQSRSKKKSNFEVQIKHPGKPWEYQCLIDPERDLLKKSPLWRRKASYDNDWEGILIKYSAHRDLPDPLRELKKLQNSMFILNSELMSINRKRWRKLNASVPDHNNNTKIINEFLRSLSITTFLNLCDLEKFLQIAQWHPWKGVKEHDKPDFLGLGTKGFLNNKGNPKEKRFLGDLNEYLLLLHKKETEQKK
jgi:hypothetical protein